MTRPRRRAAPLLAVGSAVGLLATGCGAAVVPAAAGTDGAAAGAGPPVRVVVVGDSITEMGSPDFDDGDYDASSWAWWATGGGVDVLGGWAHSGATTGDALAAVGPVQADVLVLMAGNNDVDLGVPTSTVLANLVRIADVVGVPRVLLSAVAPEDGLGPHLAALDDALAGLAREEGWQFVDPMTAVRDGDGGWRDGTTPDGVHPTEAAAARIGAALHEAVLHPDDPAGTTPAAVVPPGHTG
ncbi:SGNH/GDSL hydrolase family protein [Klenkia sp. LSe6-5]|uniref:SGNH/GDSL hydrolase family protein n=1 Tax=Klenkia sesuvii TaxID=3103137 RepID=A0ABU8DSP9_9ACTN